MTDRELEQKLADAFTRAAPDDLEAILSRCGEQNGSVMEMKELRSDPNIIDVEVTEVKPKRGLRSWLAAACVALALLGAGGGGLIYHQSYAVASVVSLDVNPSIELKVSRNERVISCTALNTEAAAVLFDMDGGADLKGTKVDVAVNAIVGALVREGYLDSISSAIPGGRGPPDPGPGDLGPEPGVYHRRRGGVHKLQQRPVRREVRPGVQGHGDERHPGHQQHAGL